MWKFPCYEVEQDINWADLESRFGWLSELKQVPQDIEYHEEGNVFIHTQMVVQELINLQDFKELTEQEKHILFAAALLHDIEKRSTTIAELQDGKERIVSPGHSRKGESTTRKMLYKEHPTPFYIREQIANLVGFHGLPLWLIEKPDPAKEAMAASLALNTKLLYILAKADSLGRISRDADELNFKLELFKEICIENDCYGKPKTFKSDYGRYLYLNKPDTAPDYEPFDDRKFNVFMIAGLPGSGKDTYIEKHFDLPILSLDNIRRELNVSPTDRKKNGQIIQLAKENAKIQMRKGQSFVFNGTNISRDMRGNWISLFMDYGGCVKIIYVEVPYKQLLIQNHHREYKVPEDVIDNLIKKLDIPSYSEAHEIDYVVTDN